MKKEYDFSQGERGKFYRPDITTNFPIYLEPEIMDYVMDLAKKKGTDVATIVNDLLREELPVSKSR